MFYAEDDDDDSSVHTTNTGNTGISSLTVPLSPTPQGDKTAKHNKHVAELHDLRIVSPTSMTVRYPTIGMVSGPIISTASSRRKKEMIPFTVQSHECHLEKQYYHVISSGTFDHFL